MQNFKSRVNKIAACFFILYMLLKFVDASKVKKTFAISEGRAAGQFVGNLNTKINIVNPWPKKFHFNHTTGVIKTTVTLDREDKSLYTFTIFPVNNAPITVDIRVKDINDEFPMFSSKATPVSNLTHAISEAYNVGHIEKFDLQVADRDEGANSVHNDSVKIVSGNVGSVFKINLKKHQNFYTISLELAKKLNWSAKNEYVLNLSASDNGTPRKTSYMKLTVIVVDHNNCRPQFSKQSYVVDVSESVRSGTVVLNISTSDCDGGKNAEVSYKMNYGSYYDKGRYFRIQQKGHVGYVVTNNYLDYETTKMFRLQIIATDKAPENPKQNTADVTVYVRDENDNDPEISTFTFFPLNEDAKVNSRVAEINVLDKDSGQNGKLNVSLDPINVFSIARSKISNDLYYVYLKTTLDYEKIKTYHIIVTATDNGKPPRTFQNSGSLRIGDVNDNPPKFYQDLYSHDVLESVKPGSPVFTINATDIDEVSASNITYHILSTNNSWFGINSSSGVIYVASTVDREKIDKVILVVQAYDGKFSANCTVVLNIIDSNDNAPDFSMPHYTMTVLENSPPAMFVGKVHASDADLTSREHIVYSLNYPSHNVFAINNITGNITTLNQLDREQRKMHNFSVIAHDEDGLQSTANVTVLVGDENDNRPFFKKYFYNCTVLESISVGTNLVKLEADDHDIGWNAQISYDTISGNEEDTFALDKRNGQISVHKKLDREKVDNYLLKFRAIDNGGLTSPKIAIVQILVQDVNDDPPVFQKDKYSFSVKENVSTSIVVGTVMAKSYDQGSGGIISYSLLNSQEHFHINNSGAIFTKTKLDHETQSKYEIMVKAQDHGTPPLFGYVNVTILVIDINDNFPTWNDDNHCIELFENHPVGVVFHVFNASDKDSGLNSQVTYSIVSGPTSVFQLNTKTGDLSLNTQADYEKIQLYQLVVQASDSGHPVLSSLLNVSICVSDINDNAPVLNNSSVDVSEDLPINSLIYIFHAVDKDSGDNGKVWYKFDDGISPSYFELSKDGNLTLKVPLDRETQAKHEVYVLAGDRGNPFQSTPTKLTIHVQDVNDESPMFSKTFSFKITENSISDIGRVEARDRDLGNNSEIEYILKNYTDKFEIDSGTGELRNIVALDREELEVYKLLVQASDQGIPPRRSSTIVNIQVQDINDNSPEFTAKSGYYYAKVAENVVKGTRIAQVKAVDTDNGQNGEVIYYLSTGNSQGGVEMFQINETSGFIYIVASLDREIKDFFVLSVVAYDKGHPPRDAICRVFVTVLDINDHKPEFKVKNDTIYISEKTSVGSVVYRANATDQDINENGNIIYSISSQHVFGINAKTGEVILNITLDYEHTKQYNLRIKASDNAKDNPKKSILRLYINILDSNDNGPIFEENPIYTQVSESVPRGTKVYKPILASDKDSGINSRIVYSIESQSPEAAFKIDPFKAQLTTDVKIDREDVSEYTLIVKAVDQAAEVSQQRSNTVTVIVIISDVNDCTPVFTSWNTTFVMEDEPLGYTVFYFTAEDKDLHQNGNVTYSLVEGNDHGIFHLDPYWGALKLMKQLDRERVDTYQFKIKASDQGSPPLSSIITFTLSVEDVNDNMPRFSKFIYRVNVAENGSISDFLRVQATDQDSGRLSYYLPNGSADDLFTINEMSGQISTKIPLDREERQMYDLTVYVQDTGYPLYTDIAIVKINVTDKNDNVPYLLHHLYEVDVPENSPVGYICSIIAQDSDTGINARLLYTIEEGDDDGYFTIDKHTGILSTIRQLDREITPVHNLIIEVKDSGFPPLSTRVNVSVTVLDENDNNPRFSKSEINVTVPGGSPPGTAVKTLTATDKDKESNTIISYSFVNEQEVPFGLDSTSGMIYTLNYLNASKVDKYSFSVKASDGSGSGARFGSIKVNIFVGHITGIPLQFTKVVYKVVLSGQVKAGQDIFQLHDQLKNSYLKPNDVEYIREGGQDVLAVGHTRGNVSFTEDPRRGGYLFSVRATLVRDQSRTAVCFVVVTVDYTIQRPSFINAVYFATLNENAVSGTFVKTVKPNFLGNVTYQIVNGNELDAFKINGNGEVTVKTSSALDYERSSGYELDIKGDWGNPITSIAFTKLYVTLHNLNDKAPVFRQKVFISSIPESSDSSNRRFVTKLLAYNFENSKLSFKIVSGNNADVFSLSSSTGELYLQKPVYREIEDLYNLTVSVSSAQLFSKCTVLVFITDINNNLPRLPEMINFTVSENSPLGSYVGKVNATDNDEYPVITYYFSGNKQRNGPFVIDFYTGILSLFDALDFESKSNFYRMDVFASDQVNLASTKVFVTVLDKNDNKPLFEKPSYNPKRKEGIPKMSILARINATDKDQGRNGQITYNITTNEEIGIYSNNGTVFTKTKLTYSKDFIDLIITATDHGTPRLSSQVPFRLQITDANNYKLPPFPNATHVSIPEDIKIGSEVVKIKAINPDSLSGNKRISFEIHRGDELKMFRIEERTGIIRVRRRLDRESNHLYTLVVSAKVNRSSADTSDWITVHIDIDDVNDNAPIFQRNKYYVSNSNISMYQNTIAEDIVPNKLVLRVLATDKDFGDNQKISYSISSGNNDKLFLINDDGELWLIKPVDRDVVPVHRLSVRATDQGTPLKASDISVVIIVDDINDNAPVFTQPRDLGVPENSRKGTHAGTIKASDLDSGPNQNISYFIANGTGLGFFDIDRRSGILTSSASFDFEIKASYTLVVKAQDQGKPPRFSTLAVVVPIIGVDEYEPVFQKSSYKFVVFGNAKKGDIVGRVHATDSDDGPEGVIKYALVLTVELFAINSSLGDIHLTENVTDYVNRKRVKRGAERSSEPGSYNLTISASSGLPGSKIMTVVAEVSMNYTVLPSGPPPSDDGTGRSSITRVQTIIIAISIVAFLVLLAFLLWLFVRCKRKEAGAKKPSEEVDLRPIRMQSVNNLPSVNSVNKNAINVGYEHVPSSATNSLESGHSSGHGSCDADDKLPLGIKVGSNVTDSGIQPDNSDVDPSSDSDVDENSDIRPFDPSLNKTERVISHLESIESIHDFDDEGGREASGGLDVGNLLFAKLAEADADCDQNVDRPLVFKFEGRPDYTGSLSSILGSHEELRGHYNNFFYGINQGPQYQPLSEVFSEIGRMPVSSKENMLDSPLNGVNEISARTSLLSSVSSLHNQHLDPESTYSSLPMTPNFTPAFTPLVTRSPSLSPLTSEVVTPMVSPSQSRPSSMYIPRSRPSSSLVQLAERDALDDFDEDVHV